MKETSWKRLHAVWLQLQDILEKAKLWRHKQSGCQWLGEKDGWLGSPRGFSEQWSYDTTSGQLSALPARFCWEPRTLVNLKNKVYLKIILRTMCFQTGNPDWSQAPQDLWRLAWTHVWLMLSVPSSPAALAGTKPFPWSAGCVWLYSL